MFNYASLFPPSKANVLNLEAESVAWFLLCSFSMTFSWSLTSLCFFLDFNSSVISLFLTSVDVCPEFQSLHSFTLFFKAYILCWLRSILMQVQDLPMCATPADLLVPIMENWSVFPHVSSKVSRPSPGRKLNPALQLVYFHPLCWGALCLNEMWIQPHSIKYISRNLSTKSDLKLHRCVYLRLNEALNCE